MEPKDKAEELIKIAAGFTCNTGSCEKCDRKYHALIAQRMVLEIQKEIPMYIGCLNPKWKFWDDVKKYLSEII